MGKVKGMTIQSAHSYLILQTEIHSILSLRCPTVILRLLPAERFPVLKKTYCWLGTNQKTQPNLSSSTQTCEMTITHCHCTRRNSSSMGVCKQENLPKSFHLPRGWSRRMYCAQSLQEAWERACLISLYAEGENFPVLWRQEAAFTVEEKSLQGAGKSFPKAGPTKANLKAPLSSIYLKADGKR